MGRHRLTPTWKFLVWTAPFLKDAHSGITLGVGENLQLMNMAVPYMAMFSELKVEIQLLEMKVSFYYFSFLVQC